MLTKRTITTYVVTTAAVIGLMLCWKWLVVDPWAAHEEARHYDAPGQFGDSYAPLTGLLTGLFSAFAFLAALASLDMQRRTNEAQTAELASQRQAADAQAKTLERAIAHMSGQEAAVREQVSQQAIANRLAAIAARLSAFQQIAEIDRAGRALTENLLKRLQDRADAIGEELEHELRAPSWGCWNLLADAKRNNTLLKETWHEKILTDELQVLLSQRNVLSQMIEQLRGL